MKRNLIVLFLATLFLMSCSKTEVQVSEAMVSPSPVVEQTTTPPAQPTGSGTKEAFEQSTLDNANIRPEVVQLVSKDVTGEDEEVFAKRVLFVESHFCLAPSELIEKLNDEGYTEYVSDIADYVFIDYTEAAKTRARMVLEEEHFSREGLLEFLEYVGFSQDDIDAAIAYCDENNLWVSE